MFGQSLFTLAVTIARLMRKNSPVTECPSLFCVQLVGMAVHVAILLVYLAL